MICQWRADQLFAESRMLRQIIYLRDTNKSRYFAITEFNNRFITRSRSLTERRKAWFHLHMSRILFAVKH